MVSANVNSAASKFTYLGQEEQNELGLNWLTFRYRNYMPDLGRFFGVDPISEDYMSISTYQFAHNSPVWKIEIEGLEGYPLTGNDFLNYEPVIGHSVLPATDYDSGSSAATTTDSGHQIVSFADATRPSTEIRSGQFNDSDFGGLITPATDAHYEANPVSAVAKDISYMGLSLMGIDGIDNAISTIADPDASTSDKVLATASVLLTTKGGGKGPKKLTPKQHFRNAEGASPALKDNPWSPREVSKRQSQTRRDAGVNPDPNTPLPDRGAGKNIKQGVHTSSGKTRHKTGERNVSSQEEHSRVAKGNRGVKRN